MTYREYVRLTRDEYDCLLSNYFSGLSGYRDLGAAFVAHWEHDPAEHPAVVGELEIALGEAVLETAEAVMREHGLRAPTDPPAGQVLARREGSA